MGNALADLHLPAKAGQKTFASPNPVRRQHLERYQAAAALVPRQVDLADAPLADRAEHLVRPDEQAAPLPLDELVRLVAR